MATAAAAWDVLCLGAVTVGFFFSRAEVGLAADFSTLATGWVGFFGAGADFLTTGALGLTEGLVTVLVVGFLTATFLGAGLAGGCLVTLLTFLAALLFAAALLGTGLPATLFVFFAGVLLTKVSSQLWAADV